MKIKNPFRQKNKPTPVGADLKTQLHDTTKYKLLSILKASDRPMERKELCGLLNTDDRRLRELKAELVDEGYPIASSSRTKGYSYGDKVLLQQTIAECYSRANKDISRALKLEEAVREL